MSPTEFDSAAAYCLTHAREMMGKWPEYPDGSPPAQIQERITAIADYLEQGPVGYEDQCYLAMVAAGVFVRRP